MNNCVCSVLALVMFLGGCRPSEPTSVAPSAADSRVSFPTGDGGMIYADEYGTGVRGVVLAHGGRFNKESWSEQAKVLKMAGFHVVSIDFRGYGQSRGPGQSNPLTAPLQLDVLAAVHYLKSKGGKNIAVIGGSMGGDAAADAAIAAPGEIERLVLLAAWPSASPEKLTSRKLFIIARDDMGDSGPRLPILQAQYSKMPDPKELLVLEGAAHAQSLFQSDQKETVTKEILRFLSAT